MKQIAQKPLVNGIILTKDNAQKFASRLKKVLEADNVSFKMTKCYDVLARTFGASNWHEMSKYLNDDINNNNIDTGLIGNESEENKQTNQSFSTNLLVENDIPSIFNLNWIEFNFFVTECCKYLEINIETTEIIKVLLLLVKDEKYKGDKSYLKKEDLTILLKIMKQPESMTRYIKDDIELFKCSDDIKNNVIDCFNYHKISMINKNNLIGFFNFMLFFVENNPLLKKENYIFEMNDTLSYSNLNNEYCSLILNYYKQFESENMFINDILMLVKIYQKELYLHDLIMYLFFKKKTTTDLFESYFPKISSENFCTYFLKKIFDNKEYCEYSLLKLNLIEENIYINSDLITTFVIKNINESVKSILYFGVEAIENAKKVNFKFIQNIDKSRKKEYVKHAIDCINEDINYYEKRKSKGYCTIVEYDNSVKVLRKLKELCMDAEIV